MKPNQLIAPVIVAFNRLKANHDRRRSVQAEEDRKRAPLQMQLAFKLLEEFFSVKGDKKRPEDYHRDQLYKLAAASKALNLARRLDPNATTMGLTSDGTPIKWTIDSFAAHLLFCEAIAYKNEAERLAAQALENTLSPYEQPATSADQFRANIRSAENYAKWDKKKAKEMWQDARRAIIKALDYEPHNNFYLNLYAECIWHTRIFRGKARAAIKQSLDIDPTNLDTLTLAQKYGVK